MSTESSVPLSYSPPPSAAPAPPPRNKNTSEGPAFSEMIGPALTILLGLALGLANQIAGGTAMGLRVPALLAALLMVGQGVNDARKKMTPVPGIDVVQEPSPGARGRELMPVSAAKPVQQVTVLPVRQPPVNLAIPITVMLLAAWLGLADLRIAAPLPLSALSLISAFALFALGWGMIPAKN